MPYVVKTNAKNITDAAGKDSRQVNDILAVYHELPKRMTDRENLYLEIVEITQQEYDEYKAVRERVKTYHKADTTEWTEKAPDMKEGWQDEDGTIYELVEKPWKNVSHDETGFSLNIDPTKNKENILIPAKTEEESTK